MFGRTPKRRWHIIMLICLTLAMVLPGLSRLPVIDRDEARYAQASVQMAESGDLLNIRFQDEARNKKPAGAYWAQTAMIKAFAGPDTRKIWAQRLPSVLGALISILLLYWGGLKLVGRDAAFIAASLLAVSLIFVFEGHIAKTDALLCATTTALFASIARLRHGGGRLEVWVFWIALGASIMIKGPIGLLLIGLTMIGLWIWEKDISWAKPLLNPGAILVFFLIWVPWVIAIYTATDGAFFAESLGKDLGGKVVSAQENHGAPPGAHLLVLMLTLWPASLFIVPALIFAIRTILKGKNSPLSPAIRLCVLWALPFWIIIELMPTKLPHYSLPVLPALCVLMGVAIIGMRHLNEFIISRSINAVLFLLASAGLIAGLYYVQTQYGQADGHMISYVIFGLAGALALLASLSLIFGKIRTSFLSCLLCGIVLSGGSYGYILPELESFQTSERLATYLRQLDPNIDSSQIHSPHYTEPSLVYHIGKDINLKSGELDVLKTPFLVLDSRKDSILLDSQQMASAVKHNNLCLETSKSVKGFNYSKGEDVSLIVLRAVPCQASAP